MHTKACMLMSPSFFTFSFQLQCEFQSFKTAIHTTRLIGDWSQHNMVVQIGTVIIMTICLCLSTKERKTLTFKILTIKSDQTI